MQCQRKMLKNYVRSTPETSEGAPMVIARESLEDIYNNNPQNKN